MKIIQIMTLGELLPFYGKLKCLKMLFLLLFACDTEMQSTFNSLNSRDRGHLVTMAKGHLG